MRFATFCIVGFLVGCSGAADSDSGSSGGGEPVDDEAPPGWYDDGPNGPGACGNAYDVVEIVGPDGTVHQVTVPIPCNPFWIDRGDPPPDEVTSPEETYGNPPPDRVLPQAQQVR